MHMYVCVCYVFMCVCVDVPVLFFTGHIRLPTPVVCIVVLNPIFVVSSSMLLIRSVLMHG